MFRRVALVAPVLVQLVACSKSAGPQGEPGVQGPQGAPGTPGVSSLIRTAVEPSGSSCAGGGVRIETGVDANGDGVLQDSEINPASTQTVCNGASVGTTAGGDLTGNYPAPQLAPGAVDTSRLADGAVTSAKMSPLGALPGQALIFGTRSPTDAGGRETAAQVRPVIGMVALQGQ